MHKFYFIIFFLSILSSNCIFAQKNVLFKYNGKNDSAFVKTDTPIRHKRNMDEFYLKILEKVEYPKIMRRTKMDADAIAQFIVNKEGKISDITLVKKSEIEVINQQLIVVLNEYFKNNPNDWLPATIKNRKVHAVNKVKFEFKSQNFK